MAPNTTVKLQQLESKLDKLIEKFSAFEKLENRIAEIVEERVEKLLQEKIEEIKDNITKDLEKRFKRNSEEHAEQDKRKDNLIIVNIPESPLKGEEGKKDDRLLEGSRRKGRQTKTGYTGQRRNCSKLASGKKDYHNSSKGGM